MKEYPSIKEGNYTLEGNVYKVGEETCYFWNSTLGGWERSLCTADFVRARGTPVKTAQEAQQRTQERPATGVLGGGENVDCKPAQEVLNPYFKNAIEVKSKTDGSEFKMYNTQHSARKTVDDLYDDFYAQKVGGVIDDLEQRKKALERLVRISEELGLYDMPDMTEKNDNTRSTTCANNRQVGGDHYKKMKIQPWDIVDSCFTSDQAVGFYVGNVLKYILRFESKSGIQDLEKAKHYLEKLIEVKRTVTKGEQPVKE